MFMNSYLSMPFCDCRFHYTLGIRSDRHCNSSKSHAAILGYLCSSRNITRLSRRSHRARSWELSQNPDESGATGNHARGTDRNLRALGGMAKPWACPGRPQLLACSESGAMGNHARGTGRNLRPLGGMAKPLACPGHQQLLACSESGCGFPRFLFWGCISTGVTNGHAFPIEAPVFRSKAGVLSLTLAPAPLPFCIGAGSASGINSAPMPFRRSHTLPPRPSKPRKRDRRTEPSS